MTNKPEAPGQLGQSATKALLEARTQHKKLTMKRNAPVRMGDIVETPVNEGYGAHRVDQVDPGSPTNSADEAKG